VERTPSLSTWIPLVLLGVLCGGDDFAQGGFSMDIAQVPLPASQSPPDSQLPMPRTVPGASRQAAAGQAGGSHSPALGASLSNPFPPPNPAVCDPRTGAWQQVWVNPALDGTLHVTAPSFEVRDGKSRTPGGLPAVTPPRHRWSAYPRFRECGVKEGGTRESTRGKTILLPANP
jgi:hypothetical protein